MTRPLYGWREYCVFARLQSARHARVVVSDRVAFRMCAAERLALFQGLSVAFEDVALALKRLLLSISGASHVLAWHLLLSALGARE